MKPSRLYCSIFLLSLFSQIFALDYTDGIARYSDAFSSLEGQNEGTTSFRSFLIPSGARTESIGTALTSVWEDISSIEYNPSVTSLINDTSIVAYHNMWIADSALETLAGSGRIGNLGLGAMLRCFYIPFSEYNAMGNISSSSYYTETMAMFNASYTFFQGYKFKGLSIGANLKTAWRGVPNYADENGAIIPESGLSQSSLALALDFGMLFRFNAGKFYSSREPNFSIGLSALNAGCAITGFTSKVQLDDPLPTTLQFGISYRPIRPLFFSLDFKQPVNIFDIKEYQMWSLAFGVAVRPVEFIEILSGFLIKGANPRISFGLDFMLQEKFSISANYTFDLTSSATPINRVSVSLKLTFKDSKRAAIQKAVDSLYQEGLIYYKNEEFEKAISVWKEALALDKHFDPALDGIKNAQKMLTLYERIRKAQQLE